jgi:hypothetical protein
VLPECCPIEEKTHATFPAMKSSTQKSLLVGGVFQRVGYSNRHARGQLILFHACGSDATFALSGTPLPCSSGGVSVENNGLKCKIPLVMLDAKQDNPCMTTKKNPNAVALGRLGGKARAANLSDAERSAIASKAAKARSQHLSPAERSRIATLAVKAREQKRKQSKQTGKGKV